MDRKFKVVKIDHIAFATESIKETSKFFSDILGIEHTEIEEVENEKVNVMKFFNFNKSTSIELLEPISNDSAVNKFINSKGRGLHHIALEVDNIINAINYLKYNNVSLIYETPQSGSDNKLITFIHPKSTPGLLVELCQK